MTEINSLDSIIHKYRGLIQPSSKESGIQSPPHPQYSPLKRNNIRGNYDKMQDQEQEQTIVKNFGRTYFYQRTDATSTQNRTPEKQMENAAVLKYKETLILLYQEENTNKRLNEEIQSYKKKQIVNEKTIKELQHLRLTQKLEYVRKLEILNSQNRTIVPNEVINKIQLLQKQAWNLQKNEDELKRRMKILQQQNLQLSAMNKQKQSKTHGFPEQMSFFKDNSQLQNCQLKQIICKLQKQYQKATKQNQKLKEEIDEMHDQMKEYVDRVTQLEQDLHGESGRLSKTMRRTKTQNGSESGKSERSQKQNNEQIQKKLKTLERDYEKLCSQMLTVESAKKIAKQTSKYYNKKG